MGILEEKLIGKLRVSSKNVDSSIRKKLEN
jgi:hypothetical protein